MTLFFHVAKTYLKLSRKQYLIPFLEGLLNVGRTSIKYVPIELAEQGIGLLLSGLNNTLAYQSNPDWVWPYWLERQQDPDAREFIPTGVNIMTANLSMRNWTSIGTPESSRESMIDPVGMLTLDPFGWSVMPYLRYAGADYYPPKLGERVQQYLTDGVLPQVITEYLISPRISWRSTALPFRAEGELLVGFNHEVKNLSDQPQEVTLGIAIRPYNPLTIGHINRLKFKNNLWRVNRKPGLLLLDEPDHVHVADRNHRDPMTAFSPDETQTSESSRSGILAGVAEYHLRLQPGEQRCIESYGALDKETNRPNRKFVHLDRPALAAAQARTLDYWRDNNQRGLKVQLYDVSLNDAFLALKNHMHVFDDQEFFCPGTFFYHTHWIRDSAFIALAFENLGFTKEVSIKIDGYLKTQTRGGFFRSQNGEWDSTGQAMYTIINHVRRSGDEALLRRTMPALLKGARWIEKMTQYTERKGPSPHAGLLPAGISAEHFGPNDYYFWDNFWSLAGLRELLWATRFLNRQDDTERIQRQFDTYHARVTEAMGQASARVQQTGLPCSPYRRMDSAAIGNLVAVAPLGLCNVDEPWVRATIEYLMEHNLRNGLFFQRIIHTGLNAYLSVQLAKVLLALDDPRLELILEALLHFASPTYTWPEAIHPVTKGGCMGDGDHGWAAGEFICLMRDMLVRESDDTLLMASGIPCHQFRDGLHLQLEDAATPYGVVNFELRQDTESIHLQWCIRRNGLQEPVPMFVLLPKEFTFEGVTTTTFNDRRQQLALQEDVGERRLLIQHADLREPAAN